MTSRRDILNIADIPTRIFHSGPRFEAALGDIDGKLGTTQLGALLHVVPAGKTAWPYHRHHGNDEIFYVVAGEGTYRVGERRLPIKAGDLIGAPAGGEAHQIINTSAAELRYIAFANHSRADVIEYPDSGRISIDIAQGMGVEPDAVFSISGKMGPLGYWEGEDMEGDKSDG